MKKIADNVDPKDFQIIKVTHYYDGPRQGTCRYQGNICEFVGVDERNPNYMKNCDCEDDCIHEGAWLVKFSIFEKENNGET